MNLRPSVNSVEEVVVVLRHAKTICAVIASGVVSVVKVNIIQGITRSIALGTVIALQTLCTCMYMYA